MTATVVPQSRLTPDLIDRVTESLRVNPSWAAAADYAGITDKCLRRYRMRAEAHNERISAMTDTSELSAIEEHPDYPYWEAHQRWLTARSRGELELIAVIRKAATAGDWRAAQALARMGWPDRYIERVEVTGADGGPLELTVEERIATLVEKARQVRCDKRRKSKKEPAMPEPEEVTSGP